MAVDRGLRGGAGGAHTLRADAPTLPLVPRLRGAGSAREHSRASPFSDNDAWVSFACTERLGATSNSVDLARAEQSEC